MKNIKKFNNIQHYNKYRHLLYKPSIVLINEKNNYGIQIQYSIKHINVDFDPIIYNGSLQTPTNITVVCNGETLTENVDYIITENNGGVNTGTYIFKVKGIGFYTRSEKTVSYTIGKASGLVNAIPSAISNLTYDGTSKNLIENGSGTGTMKYSLDNSTWSTEIPFVSNAGTHTVYYKADESTNYNESTVGSLQVTISKATPTVTAPTAKVLTYNGSVQELVYAGSTDFGTLKYSLDNSIWSTSIPTATNYGSYTVYYKVEGDSNVNDVAAQSVSCSINEKPVTATVTLSQTTYTYNGSACEPTPTVSDGGTVIDPSEYSVAYSNNVNAGTATVTISDNVGGNYNVIGSTTFTINKANPTVTAPTAKVLTYNGSAQALVNAGSTSYGTLKYSLDNISYSISIPSGTNATSYTVYYKVDGDNNINSVAASNVACSIGKADQAAPIATGATVYYGSTATAAASGGGGQGSIEWSDSNTRTAIGSQSTSARWSGNGNYNVSPWSNSVTLIVNDTIIDGHRFVDLGLPSSTKWATMNVGASSETDYGNYYQYGKGADQFAATSGQSNYSVKHVYTLPSSVDTATQVWGGQWHTPTKAQLSELIANTTYQWTTINGINGGKFTAANGNYVFLPAAGVWYIDSLYDLGNYGYYWSSNNDDTTYADGLQFNSDGKDVPYFFRDYGFSVRPVVD